MEAASDARLPPRERLTRSADYRRILRRGIRVEGRLFDVAATPGARVHDRLGITASRRVGGAVQRNRAKRLLRDAFRRRRRGAPALDLVVLAKPAAAGSTQRDLDHELARSLERLRSRLAARGAPRPARADPAG